jgi:hypothetical protein
MAHTKDPSAGAALEAAGAALYKAAVAIRNLETILHLSAQVYQRRTMRLDTARRLVPTMVRNSSRLSD